jgi:ATP-dependent exoDNAse (exonuclease V) alpha subunit
MTTLRPLTEQGFGQKKIAVLGDDGQPLRTKSGKLQYRLWAGEKTEFLQQRNAWLDLQNQHLALGGLEIRVDGRSYAERGIDIVPTVHIGVGAKAIQRKSEEGGSAVELERLKLFEEQRLDNARRIEKRPEIVLEMISSEKSVFDQRDIAKILHRYIDGAGTFSQLMARILQNPETLRIERDSVDFATGERIGARYTTRELIRM